MRCRLKASLDDQHRDVCVLHYERGLSIRATAHACGCEPNQIRRCLTNIRLRGRKLLGCNADETSSAIDRHAALVIRDRTPRQSTPQRPR